MASAGEQVQEYIMPVNLDDFTFKQYATTEQAELKKVRIDVPGFAIDAAHSESGNPTRAVRAIPSGSRWPTVEWQSTSTAAPKSVPPCCGALHTRGELETHGLARAERLCVSDRERQTDWAGGYRLIS